jgi:hypothetical protein
MSTRQRGNPLLRVGNVVWVVAAALALASADALASSAGSPAARSGGAPDAQPLVYTSPHRDGRIDLILRRDGADLVLLDGGVVAARRDLARTSQVRIGGPDRVDTSLAVDYASGPIPVPIDYHPGALGPSTMNLLSVRGAGFREERHVITGAHSGVITLDGTPIAYSNLTPVIDVVPTSSLTLSASSTAAITINIVNGPVEAGFQTIQINDGGSGSFETLYIANKTNVIVNNASTFADTFNVNVTTAAAGLATLTLANPGSVSGVVANLQATPAGVSTSFVGSGDATINVGLSGSVQGIMGPLSLSTAVGFNSIAVDDSADTTARAVTLFVPASNTGRIAGLAPANIDYVAFATSALTLSAGSGGNTLTVNQSGDWGFLTTLNTGTGNDAVNVQTTWDPLTIHGQSGMDTVIVGSLAPATTGGTIAGIDRTVAVDNLLGFTGLTIDDSGQLASHTGITITSSQVTNLTASPITYPGTDHLSSLGVNGGAGADIFWVTPWANSLVPSFTVALNGGDPGPPASPGDRLVVDTSATTTPAVSSTLTADGLQGQFTFGNAAPVSFQKFEGLLPALDTAHLSAVATQGWPITQPFVLSGTGTAPFSLASVNSGALAPGIVLNSATGAFAGTPTSAGSYSANVTVGDARFGFVSGSVALVVNPALQATPLTLPPAALNVPYSQTITVTGGTLPYTTFQVAGFNGGTTGLTAAAITADSGAGTFTIAGTPTNAGTATFTINVVDSAGAPLTVNYTLDVPPPIPGLGVLGLAALAALLGLVGWIVARRR